MDDSIDIERALKELDSYLCKKEKRYSLYTCGGASLVFLGYEGRKTNDVDLINKKLDSDLIEGILHVSNKLRINEKWMNNRVAPLGDRMGKGWREKCQVIFQGKSITLFSISRQDLINSKLHASVDRRKSDFLDLVWLSPTLNEIDIAMEYTLKRDKSATYPVFVNAFVNLLKKELGYA